MKKLSRRGFMETSVAGSIAMGCAPAALISLAEVEAAAQQISARKQAGAGVTLDAGELKLLTAAMDEIIPAGDGMPSASEVGGVDYLNRLAGANGDVAKELRASLSALETMSQKRFETSFSALASEKRIESLTVFQQQDANGFKALRNYVYEAYYLRPEVWKLMGYEFYPTNSPGPQTKPFDDAVLAEVRKKPKYFREA